MNRVLIALAGLLLLALGGSVLAVGVGVRPPHWWLHTGVHDVLLSRAERTRWRGARWWWPAVIAALALLALFALWWLTAILRRRRLTQLLVDTGDGDEAFVRGATLESVLAREAAGQRGVARAGVHLRGRRSAPTIQASLRLETGIDPATALADFTSGPLTHARDSAGLAKLPAEVRLASSRHRPERVS
ncbi:alkaline shock response membrane anchor protein AmaP [Streptomyces sp. NPDC051452]|uniref:alkaline shock response membrane anchor protein AmaP n=1 Tax=Streptomyces sp. NPDC051452 TaxID=3365654 RepID=UPI0037B5E720